MRAVTGFLTPSEIFAMHEEQEAGLSLKEIGVRHELSGVAVHHHLRARANTTLPTPFEMARDSRLSLSCAIPMYWLGFVAACGMVSQREGARTAVLSLDPHDTEFVQTLLADLLRTHATCEFCYSSLHGHQVYIRERDVGEALAQWGVGTSPSETCVALDYIPAPLLSHFVRGLLEGQMVHAPFGGRSDAAAHPAAGTQQITIPGAAPFIHMLRDRLSAVSRTIDGEVTPEETGRTALLAFRGRAAVALLSYAYRNPVRSNPRADRFVKAFASPSA